MTNDVASAKKLWSKISRNQVVRSPTTTLINLSCGRINQFEVRIERAEKSSFVRRHVGFNSLQRFGSDEKRCLHRAIVTPKADGTPRCIIKAALIRKTKRHGVGRAPEPPALEDQWPQARRSPWPRGDRRAATCSSINRASNPARLDSSGDQRRHEHYLVTLVR